MSSWFSQPLKQQKSPPDWFQNCSSTLSCAVTLTTSKCIASASLFRRFNQLTHLYSKALKTPCSVNTWSSVHHPLTPVFCHNTFQRSIIGSIQGQKHWCVIKHDKQHTSFFAQSLLKQFYAYMITISRSGFFIAPLYLHFIKTICYFFFICSPLSPKNTKRFHLPLEKLHMQQHNIPWCTVCFHDHYFFWEYSLHFSRS